MICGSFGEKWDDFKDSVQAVIAMKVKNEYQ